MAFLFEIIPYTFVATIDTYCSIFDGIQTTINLISESAVDLSEGAVFSAQVIGLAASVAYRSVTPVDYQTTVIDTAAVTLSTIARTGQAVACGTVRGISYASCSYANLFAGLALSYKPQLLVESEWLLLSSLQQNSRHYLTCSLDRVASERPGWAALRRGFRKQPIIVSKPDENNPHSKHAASRSEARLFCVKLAAAVGITPYFVDHPKKGIASLHPGSYTNTNTNGLSEPFRCDPIPQNPLFVLIDRDFHMSSIELLRLVAQGPVVMYTYTLDQLSHRTSEGGFKFSAGVLHSDFNHGVSHKHGLWDWSRDHILLSTGFGNTVLVKVDYRSCSDFGRSLVLLSPTRSFPSTSYLAVSSLYTTSALHRMQAHRMQKGSLLVEYICAGDQTSVLVNATTHYLMPTDNFLDLLAASRTSASFSVATVKIISAAERNYSLREALKLLAPYIGEIDTRPRPRTFHPVFLNMDCEYKVRGTALTKAVIDEAVVPVSSASADECCVQQRVENIRPAEGKIPDWVQTYSDDFREHLFSKIGLVEPDTVEDFLDSCSPKDKKKYSVAAEGDALDRRIRSTFQKVEAYPGVKAPRDIKDVPKPLVLFYSLYIKPLVKAIKLHCPCYAFGKSPKGVARRVRRILEGKVKVTLTDFSKFDGTQGEFLFNEFRRDLLRFFGPNHKSTLNAMLDCLHDLVHVTKYGRFFFILFQMVSGSADTSCRNTIHNMRANYIVFRYSGLSIEDAWEALGIYGGDDGLSCYPDLKKAKEVMDILGLTIKIAERGPGDQIDFLGRVYPDPFTSTRSHHDIARAAGKLHISPHELDNASLETMCWRKAVSIWVTDSRTPVISVWARNVLRLVPSGEWVTTWQSKVFAEYPLKDKTRYTSQRIMETWADPIFLPPNPAECEEALANFLDSYEISVSQYEAWERAMDTAKTLADFPEPMAVIDQISDTGISAVVDGCFTGVPMTNAETIVCFRHLTKLGCQTPRCPDHHPKKFCFNFLRGTCDRKDCKFPHISKTFRVPHKDVIKAPRPGSSSSNWRKDRQAETTASTSSADSDTPVSRSPKNKMREETKGGRSSPKTPKPRGDRGPV